MPQSKKSRLVVALAGLAFLGLAYGTWRAFSHPRAESFVLVVVDTLRADHLGAYGSDRNLTPALDALAEESYVFDQAIATSSWTRASIASMFTSRFPSPLGVLDRADVMSDEAITLAEIFKQNGYSTFGITTNGNAGESVGFAQGFDAFVYPNVLDPHYGEEVTRFPAEEVTKKALEWLKERDKTRPFFLFLHYTDPHSPYSPHEGLLPYPEPPGRFNGSRGQLRKADEAFQRRRLRQDDMDRIKYLYAGEVKYCDLWIGKLIAELKSEGTWDDLMFAVTSDHGEGLWDHGWRGHGRDLYEEMIRVPLLVRYPEARHTPKLRIAEPVSLVDLAPTFLTAADIAPPRVFRGRDLWPLTRGKKRERARPGVYAELGLDRIHLESVRVDSQKLIRDRSRSANDDDAYQLFDLDDDPGERNDLLEAGPQTATALRASLSDWRVALADHPRASHQEAPLNRLSPADLESMHALGYLDSEEYETAIRIRQEREKGGTIE